jgi:hypothetical protein
MKVLPTGGFTPYDVLIGLHVKDANRAFAVNRLAAAGIIAVCVVTNRVFVVVFIFGSTGYGSVGEYRGKFFGEKGILVTEVGRRFEDNYQGVWGDVSFGIIGKGCWGYKSYSKCACTSGRGFSVLC